MIEKENEPVIEKENEQPSVEDEPSYIYIGAGSGGLGWVVLIAGVLAALLILLGSLR